MGYSTTTKRHNQVYPDKEVLDYYASTSEDESEDMEDLDGFDDSGILNMPPPALNGGLLRRHNAAIFMPLRVSCLYG